MHKHVITPTSKGERPRLKNVRLLSRLVSWKLLTPWLTRIGSQSKTSTIH